MGWGDDVMSTGAALKLSVESGRKVVIGTDTNRYWSPMFENLPFLVRPDKTAMDAEYLQDYTGHRSYINYRHCGGRQQLFEHFRATPGQLRFSDEERNKVALFMETLGLEPGFVVVEPHVKEVFSGRNKAWPWDHWVKIIDPLKEKWGKVVQVSKPGALPLPGIDVITDFNDVRLALCLLQYAKCVVTTDGLLHHAAAALDIPAVVIWGARTNPKILGYEDHVNLTSQNPQWCGSMKQRCKHCEKAMLSIEPERVWLAVEKACAILAF